jgi:hypothetical protein
MLANLILLLVCAGGILREGWWIIPIGTIGLCAESIIDVLNMLLQRPSLELDWAEQSFLTQTIGNALATCAAIYLMGAVAAAMFLSGS